jgi:hypothetical protein
MALWIEFLVNRFRSKRAGTAESADWLHGRSPTGNENLQQHSLADEPELSDVSPELSGRSQAARASSA